MPRDQVKPVFLAVVSILAGLCSLLARWYETANDTYWILFRQGHSWTEVYASWNLHGDGQVMYDMKVMIIAFSLLSLVFVTLCLVDSRLGSVVAGFASLFLGAVSVAYFVVAMPYTLHLSGFMGADHGPLGGFWLLVLSCVAMGAGVLLRAVDSFDLLRRSKASTAEEDGG